MRFVKSNKYDRQFASYLFLIIMGFLLSIPTNSMAINVFYWSVDIKHKRDGFKIVTKSNLIGGQKIRHYKLGDYRKILQSGRFELGVLPLTNTSTGEISSLQGCDDYTIPEKFSGDIELLEKYLTTPSGFQRIRFELVLVPRDTRFSLSVTEKITSTIPFRLAMPMPMPKNKTNCGQWWDKVQEKFTHEFIHVHDEVMGFSRPNDESAEVTAYSLVSCLALQNQNPAQIFPDWYQASDEFDFKKEYEDIISGKAYKPAKLAKQPSIIGNGITLLNFYHLYGDSFPESPTAEQRNKVEK